MNENIRWTAKRLGLWYLLVLLGPLNLWPGFADLAGHVRWRQVAAGMLGSYIWFLTALVVLP